MRKPAKAALIIVIIFTALISARVALIFYNSRTIVREFSDSRYVKMETYEKAGRNEVHICFSESIYAQAGEMYGTYSTVSSPCDGPDSGCQLFRQSDGLILGNMENHSLWLGRSDYSPKEKNPWEVLTEHTGDTYYIHSEVFESKSEIIETMKDLCEQPRVEYVTKSETQ